MSSVCPGNEAGGNTARQIGVQPLRAEDAPALAWDEQRQLFRWARARGGDVHPGSVGGLSASQKSAERRWEHGGGATRVERTGSRELPHLRVSAVRPVPSHSPGGMLPTDADAIV